MYVQYDDQGDERRVANEGGRDGGMAGPDRDGFNGADLQRAILGSISDELVRDEESYLQRLRNSIDDSHEVILRIRDIIVILAFNCYSITQRLDGNSEGVSGGAGAGIGNFNTNNIQASSNFYDNVCASAKLWRKTQSVIATGFEALYPPAGKSSIIIIIIIILLCGETFFILFYIMNPIP